MPDPDHRIRSKIPPGSAILLQNTSYSIYQPFEIQVLDEQSLNVKALNTSVVDQEGFIPDPEPALNFPSSGSGSRQKFRIDADPDPDRCGSRSGSNLY